jgi:serpin B
LTTAAALAAIVAVFVGGANAAQPAASRPRAASAAIGAGASAENGFALSLLRLLGRTGNVVYSPYSIDTALTMADAGAAGQTASQISAVLHAPAPASAVTDAAAVTRSLDSAVGSGFGAPQLELANALWTATGLALEHRFVKTLSNSFAAPPQSTDFAGAPQAALATINAWVAAHTAQLIRNLLGPGSITPQTAFVLANAVYLKARWAAPFNAELTHPARFTTAGGEGVQVPFMTKDDADYRYAAGSDYQAVDLPYLASSLSLLAILPRGTSLTRFDATLSATALARIVGTLAVRSVNLMMPKLNLSTQTSLNAPLAQLGMTDAFTPAANFSAITKQRALDISLVEHAADLKIDEAGTIAAAATAIIGPTAIARPPLPTVTLTLNHPYLLLLRDDADGAIVFVAAVANPAQS